MDEHRSVAQKLLTGGGERSSAFVADEKRSAQLLLEVADSCAYGRLGDIQALRGSDETPCRNDLDKSAGELNIHGGDSIKIAFKCQSISFAR
ncbi:hypothetical protein BQ8482_480138 [Mesorhizobium delmotii]|uniref:Uncharacterized protein n=1 Tax=Mesorhizobium delmotii TaxID=1631247 RepID=A0A2P9AU55_9HYPH|nr:hypothetical protein BQ8482_480138 [Mesorhizobium delmotii]